MVNKARRKLSLSAKTMKQLYSSKLFKTSDCATLTVHQCKPKENACILSSISLSPSAFLNEKRKPKTVLYYNQTTYGVDIADQIAQIY